MSSKAVLAFREKGLAQSRGKSSKSGSNQVRDGVTLTGAMAVQTGDMLSYLPNYGRR
jgi:hypothetical protein